ncbi:hypothetical protein PIB30_102657, partial [Stylosanthes scabra]|nr:hypothetical protein [Stylosanthes scabra]
MLFTKVIYDEDQPEVEEDDGAKEKPYGKMKYVAVIKAEILKSLVKGGLVKAEKLKSLLHDGYKGSEKLRFLTISRKKSSWKVWVLRFAYLLLLWTILVQFKGIIGDMVSPKFFNTRSSITALASLPPENIFDVDYFIHSLRDEVRILKELPPEQKHKVESESLYSMPPISWSNMTYYYDV